MPQAGIVYSQIDLGEDGESFAFIYSIENPKGTSPRKGVGAQVRPLYRIFHIIALGKSL